MESHITTLVRPGQEKSRQRGSSIAIRFGDTRAPMVELAQKNKIHETRTRLGMSLAKLEEITGISAQQINRLEKGERRWNQDNIRALAAALECRPEDLIGVTDTVPVLGEVGAGAVVYPVSDLPLLPRIVARSDQDYINCKWVVAPPGAFPHGVVALEVTGDSMLPIIVPGSIIYYSERFEGGAPDHCINKLCMVQLRDGKAYIKLLKLSHYEGRVDLVSTNMKVIPAVELEWCAPVIFIKPF